MSDMTEHAHLSLELIGVSGVQQSESVIYWSSLF